MDIQGNELKALRGAEGLLKAGKISVIYLETYFIQQYENQPLFLEIANFLQGYNYRVQDFYNPYYGKGSIAWCDVVFIKNE